LPNRAGNSKRKRRFARYLGFGDPEFDRVLECTAQRATTIGYGVIKKDERHEFFLPLPPCLKDLKEIRRLIVTLAWFSPINPGNRKYRKASLCLDIEQSKSKCAVNRKEADGHQVKNGTVQHEILEGKKQIRELSDGDNLIIPVICREDANSLDEEVFYGLAVTLEVSDTIDVPLYDEIRDRIAILDRILD